MKPQKLYGIMTAGGFLGMVAAFLQTLEKLTLIEHKDKALACDLNSVFSCSNVLNSWQSSVFGFPNSIMCLTLFTIFTISAAAGAAGSKLAKGFRLAIQGLSLFTLGFALWFLWESTYKISSLCIFCIFCTIGLLLVNGAWLRINVADLPVGAAARKRVKRAIETGADIFGWTVLGLLVAFAMILHFS